MLLLSDTGRRREPVRATKEWSVEERHLPLVGQPPGAACSWSIAMVRGTRTLVSSAMADSHSCWVATSSIELAELVLILSANR